MHIDSRKQRGTVVATERDYDVHVRLACPSTLNTSYIWFVDVLWRPAFFRMSCREDRHILCSVLPQAFAYANYHSSHATSNSVSLALTSARPTSMTSSFAPSLSRYASRVDRLKPVASSIKGFSTVFG